MLVVALDSLIEACCHSRGHVKNSSDVTSSSADKSFSHEGSGIAVNGRDSDPLCDCRIAHTSELWNSGDSGASHDSPASIDRFNDLDSPGDGGISLEASFSSIIYVFELFTTTDS